MVLHSHSWYTQSGVLPYRVRNKEVQILLITSRRRRRWIIPKGIVEPFHTPQGSAAKEAYEEAGIRGSVSSYKLGEYEYEKWGGVCTVAVYPMEVLEMLEEWPEMDFRTRKWMNIDEALPNLRPEQLRDIVRAFPKYLNSI